MFYQKCQALCTLTSLPAQQYNHDKDAIALELEEELN